MIVGIVISRGKGANDDSTATRTAAGSDDDDDDDDDIADNDEACGASLSSLSSSSFSFPGAAAGAAEIIDDGDAGSVRWLKKPKRDKREEGVVPLKEEEEEKGDRCK
eukprot:jgi/Bigna1/130309/aug1.11_g5017